MSKWGRYDFCNLESKKKWDKVFEDRIEVDCDDKGHEEVKLINNSLTDIIERYFLNGHFDVEPKKVKIKVDKDCIQIERIE